MSTKPNQNKHLSPIVFVSSQLINTLRYHAKKYPNGAMLIRKIDRKIFKNKSIKKKRYRLTSYSLPVQESTMFDRPAINYDGYKIMEYK